MDSLKLWFFVKGDRRYYDDDTNYDHYDGMFGPMATTISKEVTRLELLLIFNIDIEDVP